MNHRNTSTPARPTKPKRVDKKDGPPAADLESYDRKLKETFELQAHTSGPSWKWFFGGMLESCTAAEKALKSCEKMNDVIRCQATIAYVESQLARLARVAQDLNDMRTRYPLFTQDYPYRADFDELTGRVTVIRLSAEDRDLTPPTTGEEPDPAPMLDGGLDEDEAAGPGEPGDPFDN